MRCELLGVNRVYVDNLGPTSIEETLLKFWWNLYIYIYIYKKKKLPEKNFQCIAKLDVENRGCYIRERPINLYSVLSSYWNTEY